MNKIESEIKEIRKELKSIKSDLKTYINQREKAIDNPLSIEMWKGYKPEKENRNISFKKHHF